jgi:CheY-like chemotaxis protein
MSKQILCLLIEDDVDDQEIFCKALKDASKDAVCMIAKDGIEGLEMLKSDLSFVPNFIFIDVNMPKMNGMECLERVKKLPHLSGTSVVMYSTTSEQKILLRSKALGAFDFIIKPSSIPLLSERLDQVFHKEK